jgi:CheY-like chemotaxis protein
MLAPWNVLVVDDEEDIHGITALALKRKNWRGRPIAMKSARSGREARELLLAPDAPKFHCALVDVVMETDDAGLQLCDFVRSNMPRTIRLVLRTGQPGKAPPEKVLNDYDIDYYLAKTDVTEERLFSVLRACFRSSLDIAALVVVGEQQRALTHALREPTTTPESLVAIMSEPVRYLTEKYSAKVVFLPNTREPALGPLVGVEASAVAGAIDKAAEKQLALRLLPGEEVDLPKGTFVFAATSIDPMARTDKGVGERMKQWFQSFLSDQAADAHVPTSGVALQFEKELDARQSDELTKELELLLTNWTVAESSLRLADKFVRDRMHQMSQHGRGV